MSRVFSWWRYYVYLFYFQVIHRRLPFYIYSTTECAFLISLLILCLYHDHLYY